MDTVRAAAIADSCKKIPNGSVTAATLSSTLQIEAENIVSIPWSKISDIPAGFADGVDNTGEGGAAADSVRAASIADSSKKIPNSSVTTAKLADGAVTDAKITGVAWGKVTGKPSVYRTHSDSITWKAGTAGQVWKMGATGPGWGTDLQGSAGASTIAGITGLSDSLTAHRSLIHTKADAADLADKADAADVYGKTSLYTKTEVDTKLSGKADAADLADKADAADVYGKTSLYTKTEVDTKLSGKADASGVYGKTEVDALMGTVAGGDGNEASVQPVMTIGEISAATSVTLSIPEDGYILAYATATLKAVGNDYSAVFGCISTSSSTMQDPKNNMHWYVNRPAFANVFSSSRFIPVSKSQGTITLYLLFEQEVGSSQVITAQMNCVFIKQRL